MDPTADLIRRSRVLASIALVGAVVLLGLLIAVPLLVPHEILPAPLLVFWGIFILLVALILGIAVAYVLLTRGQALGTGRPPGAERPAEGIPADRPEGLEGLAIRILDGDERRLFRAIVEAKGAILQRDLVRATSFSDAKVSRLLDRLEGRGLVVRERHGMTNRVRLTIRGG